MSNEASRQSFEAWANDAWAGWQASREALAAEQEQEPSLSEILAAKGVKLQHHFVEKPRGQVEDMAQQVAVPVTGRGATAVDYLIGRLRQPEKYFRNQEHATAALIEDCDKAAAMLVTYVQQVQAESITDYMMNLVDRLGHEADAVDARAWQHLLVYAPKQAHQVAVPAREPMSDAQIIDRIIDRLNEPNSTAPQGDKT